MIITSSFRAANGNKRWHSLISVSTNIGTEIKSLMFNSKFRLSVSEFMERFFLAVFVFFFVIVLCFLVFVAVVTMEKNFAC